MDRDAVLAHIAHDKLGFQTLKVRNLDRLDFQEVSVWGVKAALEAAFEAGVNSVEIRKADKT